MSGMFASQFEQADMMPLAVCEPFDLLEVFTKTIYIKERK
jgi:hypothetical protein